MGVTDGYETHEASVFIGGAVMETPMHEVENPARCEQVVGYAACAVGK